jgi:hypothetical protein
MRHSPMRRVVLLSPRLIKRVGGIGVGAIAGRRRSKAGALGVGVVAIPRRRLSKAGVLGVGVVANTDPDAEQHWVRTGTESRREGAEQAIVAAGAVATS